MGLLRFPNSNYSLKEEIINVKWAACWQLDKLINHNIRYDVIGNIIHDEGAARIEPMIEIISNEMYEKVRTDCKLVLIEE